MSPFYFLRPILEALNDGKLIRTSMALILQVIGVVSLLAGAYVLVEMLKISFRLQTEGTIGGLILAILFVAAVLGMVQVLFYRAANIRELDDSPYTVIPICSILLRALGEIYALFGVAVGVGGCIFIWLSGSNPFFLLPGIGGMFPVVAADRTFLGGLLFLLNFGLVSFAGVIAFYFLAESIVVMVDIAKNTRSKQTAS